MWFSNLMYNCSEQPSMQLHLKKAVFTMSFNAYEHSTSQWSHSCTCCQLSSFPTPHPPHPPKDIHLHVELDGVHAEDLVADVGEHVARRDDAQPRGKLHHLLQKNMCVGICIFHRICIFHCICIWLWNLDLWFPLPLVWKITVGPELDCSSLRKSRVRISLQLDLKMRQFVMICDCFLENMTTHDNMRLFTGKYSNKQMNSDLL